MDKARKLNNPDRFIKLFNFVILLSGHRRGTEFMTHVQERNDSYRIIWGEINHIKQPFGRLRMKCEDNVQLELREMGYDDVNWI